MQYGELRSYCGSRLVKFVLWIFINFKDTFKTEESFLIIFFHLISSPTVGEVQTRERGDRTESDISPVHVSTTVDDGSGRPDDTQANKTPEPHKKESKKEQSDPLCSEIPEWLQEFREILVDDEVPVHGDSHANSFHEVSLEPIFKRREDLGKHSVDTHFPKDRNCEICTSTKITRAPCRTRNGGAVPRAENFGDLITADHKVLSDNCESRNNHRYAVGHGRLWPNRLWPKPTLAKPTLANTSLICCVVFVLCCVVLCCVLSVWRGYCFTVSKWGFMCGCWFQGLVWTALPGTVLPGTALPLDRPSPGPPFPWTALPLDRPSPGPPKISLFFSLSRRKIRSFLPSLRGKKKREILAPHPSGPHPSGPTLGLAPGLHEKTK